VDTDNNFQEKYLNQITNILNESYSPPNNGKTAFADLYTLYHLWWLYGGGKEAYGYDKTNATIPTRLEEKINDYFEHAVFFVGKKLIEESLEAIYDEMENIVDEYIIPDQPSLYNYIQKNNIPLKVDGSTGTLSLPEPREYWGKIGLSGSYKLFKFPGWINPQSDLYGGEKWADIVNEVRNLSVAWKKGRRAKDAKDVMFAIDRLYDLEHNTGTLGSKLKTMSINKSDLDARANAKNLQDLVNLGVSPQVKNLVKSATHFGKGEPILERIKKSSNWVNIVSK
jgi:hypothetical protein